MPLISVNGELKGKMFSCLKESIGKFEPAVSKHLFRPPNLYVTCSKSSKMDKTKMREWIESSVLNDSPSNLVLHSWAGAIDETMYILLPKNCTRLRNLCSISTLIQLFNVYFFDSTNRNEIIKIHTMACY